MNNNELFFKIKNELGNKYLIGLHNATKSAYIMKTRFAYDKYYMNLDKISEDDIVSSILSNGLYVPDKLVGLMSTVSFIKKVIPNSFNYSYYYDIGSNKRYVVIVAIPNYICLGDKKYHLSNMVQNVGIVNYSLFDTLLPKELIYGYYVKNINHVEKFLSYDMSSLEIIFDDELEFHMNKNFYGYMSCLQQERFWIKYFQDNGIDVEFLEVCNNFHLFNELFHSSNIITKSKKLKK